MSRRTLSQGGRQIGGKGRRSPQSQKSIVKGITFRPEILDAIDALPQVLSGEWSRSYLLNQLAANWLNLPTDYEWSDLDIVRDGGVVD
jgi:hypothetical protein